MKIFNDHKAFEALTQPIGDLSQELIDLIPDTCVGLFWPKRLNELIEFCKKNPEYHIMSIHSFVHVEINSPVPQATFYRLAKGNADPELTLVPTDTLLHKANLF